MIRLAEKVFQPGDLAGSSHKKNGLVPLQTVFYSEKNVTGFALKIFRAAIRRYPGFRRQDIMLN